ncbi:MAG: Stk1 family PASTA domain-containing Ser/Thr kinase [Actinomycetota bacterium]
MTFTAVDPLLGQVLDGRYVVHSKIATGGMASVYRGEDLRLEREVAVKVIHQALAEDSSFAAQFAIEARSIARLSHPNIVQVFDQGNHRGLAFLTMEYIPGKTLRDVIKLQSPLPAVDALNFLEPVLDGLAAAHRAGITHRDVKPENVLVADNGTIKVADFGLARRGEAGLPDGQMYGTVSYVAPEQVSHGIADPRSDVYAVGVVLFELLTGTKPFFGATPAEIAAQHVSDRVPAPSSRVTSVPPVVDEMVRLATMKHLDERPTDAREMLIVLRETRRKIKLSPEKTNAGSWPLPLPAAPSSLTASRDHSEETEIVNRTTVQSIVESGHDMPSPPSNTTTFRVVASPDTVHRRRRAKALTLLLLVVVCLLGIAGWYLGSGSGSSTQSSVPQLIGLTEAKALAALKEQGLRGQVNRQFDETVPTGIVITANQKSGARVPVQSVVLMTVSRGVTAQITVPPLSGLAEGDARSAILSADLAVGSVERRYDPEISEGIVMESSPSAGEKVPGQTPLNLVISKGPTPIPIKDWRGKSADEAERALVASGLRVAQIKATSEEVPTGVVIAQLPAGGSGLPGSTVELTVSTEPRKPSPSESALGRIKVPNVTGLSIQRAQDELESVGLVADIARPGRPLDDNAEVLSQEPSAGQSVAAGTRVTLVATPGR